MKMLTYEYTTYILRFYISAKNFRPLVTPSASEEACTSELVTTIVIHAANIHDGVEPRAVMRSLKDFTKNH